MKDHRRFSKHFQYVNDQQEFVINSYVNIFPVDLPPTALFHRIVLKRCTSHKLRIKKNSLLIPT